MEHESAAADPGRLRLDQPQHRLHRDCGIDRTAAERQYLNAGNRGVRIGGRHHIAALLRVRRARKDCCSRDQQHGARASRDPLRPMPICAFD